jgi:hypothetical protein
VSPFKEYKMFSLVPQIIERATLLEDKVCRAQSEFFKIAFVGLNLNSF